MRLLIKFYRLPNPQRWLIIDAAVHLLVGWAALRVVPFRRLVWFFQRPARKPELVGPERLRVRNQVAHIIPMVSRKLPVKIVCFPRAMAAQAMLRRRGISTVLYYGARPGSSGPLTHCWVQDGADGVIGLRTAQNYVVLAVFSGNLDIYFGGVCAPSHKGNASMNTNVGAKENMTTENKVVTTEGNENLKPWLKPKLSSAPLNEAMTGGAGPPDGGGYLHS